MSIRTRFVLSVTAIQIIFLSLVLCITLGLTYVRVQSAVYNAAQEGGGTVDAALVNKVFSQSTSLALIVAAAGVVLTIALGSQLGWSLKERLNNIALMVKKLREGQRADQEVDSGADEIGRLSRFIHDLGEQIIINMKDLRAAEERFRIAIKAAGAGAWKWDIKTGEMFWSVGSYYALGYLPDKDKATLELWRSAIHPDDLMLVDRAISEMMANQSSIDVEYRIVRPNGEVRWMRSVGSVHFDAQENPDEIYGLQIDITRQRRLQNNLREQQSLLRAVLDSSSDSVVTLDASQNILMVNSSLLHMFQYSELELLGKPIRQLLHDEGVAIINAYIEQCTHSQLEHFERNTNSLVARRKDGSKFKAGVSISGMSTHDHSLRFVVSIANLSNERRHRTMLDMEAVT